MNETVVDMREPELVREELDDLMNYIGSLPHELRQNGAFVGYEQRAAELSRELILAEMKQFLIATSLTQESLFQTQSTEYYALQKFLDTATQRYQRRAEQLSSTNRVLSWTAFITTTGGLLSAIATPGFLAWFPVGSLVVPLTAVSASLLAALSCFRFSEKARTSQQLADNFDTLRNEIAHSFGPSGEVLGPAEYYPASTKRIEDLIVEIQRRTVTVVESSGAGTERRE